MISSFVYLTSFLPRIKGVKHSVKTVSSNSKSEDRQDTKQNLRFIQRKNGNPFTKSSNLNYLDTKFNALESNMSYDSKAVSTELCKMFNSEIKTVTKDNNFKNQTSDQTLKQIYLCEIVAKQF